MGLSSFVLNSALPGLVLGDMTVVLDTAEKLEAASEMYKAMLITKGAERAHVILTQAMGEQNALRARFEYEKSVGIIKAQPEVVSEVEI